MTAPDLPSATVPGARGRHVGPLVVRSASSTAPGAAAVAEVAGRLGTSADLALAFVPDGYADDAVADALTRWAGNRVIGCTSSGGIGPRGYQRDGLVAVTLTGAETIVRTVPIPLTAPGSTGSTGSTGPTCATGLGALRKAAAAVAERRAFAILLVDGLSRQEEVVTERVSAVLGGIPLIGGSASAELRVGRAAVLADGRFRPGTATVTVVATDAPFQAFRIQHHRAAGPPMVVTSAIPEQRLVRTLDGRPAAAVYAAVTGVEPTQLLPGHFARRPLLIRAGGEWARSIAAAAPDGALLFHSAVEQGSILRPAAPASPARAVQAVVTTVDGLRTDLGGLAGALVFDCVQRRREFEALGIDAEIGRLLSTAGAAGFSTYGEQYDVVHINHSLVGVAFGA